MFKCSNTNIQKHPEFISHVKICGEIISNMFHPVMPGCECGVWKW
jgi:hypothetical protein